MFQFLLGRFNARKGRVMATNKDQGRTNEITDEQIRKLAYEKWEQAGRPPGDGNQFWEEAQKELNQKK